ncbi:MAG: DUF1461 domain-containing protein [Pseudomonadota bacterium]
MPWSGWLRGALYAVLLLMTALWLAWLLLARVDFFYPTAYRALDIGATLATYAPNNRYGKRDFAVCDAREHARLFAEIAHAIRHDGDGLNELRYRDPSGRELGVLLTADEVTHLRDVARLVAVGEALGLAAALGWLVMLALLRWRGLSPPGARAMLAGGLALAVLLAALLAAVGPLELFYAWHAWVFPPGHPWFFYYEDSLMSSLMKAPDLFAFIGAVWLFTGLFLLLALASLGHAIGRPPNSRRSI